MARAEEQQDGSSARRLIEEDMRLSKIAVVKYSDAAKEAAIRGSDPEKDPDVQLAHARMDTAVYSAFQSLRPYVREDLPHYWGYDNEGEKVDGAVDLLPESDREMWGLASIGDFYASVDVKTHSEWTPDEGNVPVTEANADLIPPEACVRAHNLLSEAQVKLGLGASTTGIKREAEFTYDDLFDGEPPENNHMEADD